MGVIRQASFLIPNETELAILTDMPIESEDKVSTAAQSLVKQGVETVIVTLGARGGLLATHEGVRHIAPVKVQAVDTTGAGDAFIGSFARYLAGGLALDAALTEATRYSAFSVTRHGAQKSFATEAEFAAFSASLN
jgi:ribokinase